VDCLGIRLRPRVGENAAVPVEVVSDANGREGRRKRTGSHDVLDREWHVTAIVSSLVVARVSATYQSFRDMLSAWTRILFQIVLDTLQELKMANPKTNAKRRQELLAIRKQLAK